MLSAAVASAAPQVASPAECTGSEQMVSFQTPLPGHLAQAMSQFIEAHPQWDQYRQVQAAIAGFLFQQGCKERAVVQHSLSGLFRKQALTPDGLHS